MKLVGLALVASLGAMSCTAGDEAAGDDGPVVALALGGLPAPGTLTSPIEGFAFYDRSIDTAGTCGDGTKREGPRLFSEHVAPLGIAGKNYAVCGGFHAPGMALDIWIDGFDAKQQFADWLVANHSEMARRLGLVQIIWNHHMWRSYDAGPGRPQGAFGAYGGSDPHTSHVHISFGEDGAQGVTSFFTEVIGARAGTYAFQANTHELWTHAGPTGLGMMAGTSPSLARVAGGTEVAFQANTGSLWVTGAQGTGDLGLGMAAGTSPSVTAFGSGYAVAFQANTGSLWLAGAAGTGDQGLGMMTGTSPSIAAIHGGVAIAFQANTGALWLAGALGTGDQGLGMMAGTSPSLTALAGGGYQIAFQANTGELWVAGSLGTGPTGLGMMAGTSPSITALAGGGYQVAFQANTGALWVTGHAGTVDTGLGMMAGTSPTISARGNSYEVLFQANTGELYRSTPTASGSLGLGMAPSSNPAGK